MATTKYSPVQGSQLFIMNQTVSPHVAVVVPAMQGIDNLGGQATSIPITNFDSIGYMEYAKGLVDPGKPSGNIVFDYNNATLQLLNKLLGMGDGAETSFFYAAADGTAAPTVVAGVLTPPKTGASPGTFTRSGWLFNGFVADFTIQGQTNNVVIAKFAVQATGPRQLAVKGQSTLIY